MRAAVLVVLVGCGGGGTSSDVDAGGTTIDGKGSSSVDASGGGASVSCEGKAAQPLDATWNLTVGSTGRKALVHVPASYNPQTPTPVVVDLHGRTGWASQQAGLSHSKAKSDAEGFIVIYPESATSPTAWNAGGGCCDPAAANQVDDTGFIAALLDEAVARLCVDPDRVYAMGLSNGGYLAYRLACELGDRFAAIGSVAGLLSLQSCAPTRAMPVFQVHGTQDSIVSYDWVDETVNYWKVTNGCSTISTTYQQGDATCVTHSGCTGGADVVLCTIQGGGHQWPGGEALPFLGTKSDDLIATDRIWDFFVAHPR